MPLKNIIVIVTHNMQQAIRTADYTGFMYLGDLIEFGKTNQVFENPKEELTQRYVEGILDKILVVIKKPPRF